MADISTHNTQVEGAVAEAAAVAGNPLLIGGDDGTNARFVQMRTEDDSIVAGDIHLVTVGLGYLYDGTSWVRTAADTGGKIRVVGSVGVGNSLTGDSPLVVGARGNLNEPAIEADGESVWLWCDLFGRLVTVDGHPNPVDPVYVNATASGDTTLLTAPGASLSLYIQKILIVNGGAAVNNVQLQVDLTAVNRGPGDLAADGGGAMMLYGARGWKIAANTGLDVNLGAAGDVHVTVLQHYIAP